VQRGAAAEGAEERASQIIRKLDLKPRIVEMACQTPGGVPMRKLIVLAAAASALLVASCNTVAGVGKDVSAAGQAVTKTADDVKK
jgi:predicted small secreted protein